MADEYSSMAYDYSVTHIVGGTGPQPGTLSWLITIPGNQRNSICVESPSSTHHVSSQQPTASSRPGKEDKEMGTSQHECWQHHVLSPSPLLTVHPVSGHYRRSLGLSLCFLAASSQYCWSFCLVKQKVENCWPASTHGSGPSHPFLHLSSRSISVWHVVIRVTQLTELGPGTKVHQIEQLLVHQQYSAVLQRNNITLLEWEQPVQ